MSTKRGRKKAAAKPAAPVVQDEEPEVTAAELQATAKPAAPPSPIVTLAKQAITPVVAAARRAASTIAAALPAIPEASAVDAAELDFDKQQQHLDSPRSPTGQRTLFSEAPSGLHDDLSLQEDDAAPGSDQQQHGMHSNISHQRDELDDELEPLQDQQQQATTAAALGGQLKQQALMQLRGLSQWIGAQRSSFVLPVLALGLLLLAGLFGMVILQGSALQAQQGTITQQQHRVAAQQTALASLHEQLQQAQQQLQALPDMQQLQDAASSCKAGLGNLGSSQDSLQETLDSLAALAGQLRMNISSLSQASALGEKAWQLLEAATAANSAALTGGAAATAAAAVAAPALLQQTQQQQVLAEQLQQSMAVLDTLPTTIKQEVKQQLTAALPPVDLALADCGARIVFHTPLNATTLAAAAAAGGSTAGSDSPSSGAMQWLQQQVAQKLLPGSVAVAKQQHTQLLSAVQINHIILRPHGAFPASAVPAGNGAAADAVPAKRSVPCLPLLLAPGNASAAAAVLEIALPQLAAIKSVTFYHTLSALEPFGSYGAAPGVLQIAFANSSSCPAGICSAVGHAALVNSSAADVAAAADGAVPDVVQSVLAPSVVGVQQEVHLYPESFASGRAVVKVQKPAAAAAAAGDESSSSADGVAGVVADRLIVHVSSSMGGGEGLCMQRISVQGMPLDPAGFC